MAEASTEPTLRGYLIVLRRRKWWVIVITLLGLGASLAMALTQAKQYSATAQLLVQSSSSTSQSAVLGGTQQPVTPTDVQTELQLATSAPVLRTVSSKLGSEPPISASEVAQTNVIALTAIASTPAKAALVANTYARAFVWHNQSVALASLTTAQSRLRTQIASLTKQINTLRRSPSRASQQSALANQQSVLRQELAQLQVNGAAAASGVEFVTPARAPSAPSSPKPPQDALLGLAAGLLVGLGVAFARDSLDDALTSKEAAERLSGAPVLALVPMVNSWKKRDRPMVASAAEPTSPAAESYRSLRTSLQFARQARDLKTLLVTSPAAAEGKTSTLANLGAVFAQAGERVALVSCDLRRPRLGQFFGLEEQSGLTTVLLGQQTLEEVLQPVQGYECLWMLGAGPVPPNPAELLNGPMTKEIFDTLRESFDLVLVDSPPVLPVTDAMVLSKHADGTLIVVAAGQSRKNELHRTAEKFTQASASVVGLVLNEVTKQNAYGGGYGYGYGYGYGSYVAESTLVSAPHANGNSAGVPGSPQRGHRPR
ncbi:MAG TPA: polysaccharide biosynthesis tyrosine autokinase [Streptosporangiaceae bacterium]|jgi:capsular exopolysaccharide synthesis family protein|nr:polysaccharide biosynthesis tyrosine autokinase [Streptosporangiaceae bacterium]